MRVEFDAPSEFDAGVVMTPDDNVMTIRPRFHTAKGGVVLGVFRTVNKYEKVIEQRILQVNGFGKLSLARIKEGGVTPIADEDHKVNKPNKPS